MRRIDRDAFQTKEAIMTAENDTEGKARRKWIPGVWAREVALPDSIPKGQRHLARSWLLLLSTFMSDSDDEVRAKNAAELCEMLHVADTEHSGKVLTLLVEGGVLVRPKKQVGRTYRYRPNRDAPTRHQAESRVQKESGDGTEPVHVPPTESEVVPPTESGDNPRQSPTRGCPSVVQDLPKQVAPLPTSFCTETRLLRSEHWRSTGDLSLDSTQAAQDATGSAHGCV
jgi:hypothetical protein